MADRRDSSSRGFGAILIWLGLREDERRDPHDRALTDLAWAILGPVIAAGFIWTVFGETIGMIGVLLMVPFLVVGVRDVLSGRAAERNAQRRKQRG